jgi:hypothetical protein
VEQKYPTIFTPSMWRQISSDPYMQSTQAAVPRRSGAVISQRRLCSRSIWGLLSAAAQ